MPNTRPTVIARRYPTTTGPAEYTVVCPECASLIPNATRRWTARELPACLICSHCSCDVDVELPAPNEQPFERVIRQALETGRLAPEEAATYDRPDLAQLWRDQEDDAILLGEAFIADALAYERYSSLSSGLGRALRAAFLLGYSFGETGRDDEDDEGLWVAVAAVPDGE